MCRRRCARLSAIEPAALVAAVCRAVDDAARGLLALGIHSGEHVAVWATNVPQWVLLQFATARIGAVLVTINPAYRPFELEYVLEQAMRWPCSWSSGSRTSDYFAMLAEVCPELADRRAGPIAMRPHFLACAGSWRCAATPPAGAISWDEMCRRGQSIPHARLGRDRPHACSRPTPINIQYTSGTTGFPKAATLSHRNLLLNTFYVGHCLKLTDRDRICIPVPFYHCFGCVLGTLCAVVHGAAMIVPAESFDPTATLDAIERERATAIYGVPTMYIAELQRPQLAPAAIFRRCAPASCRAAPARSKSCEPVVDEMGVPRNHDRLRPDRSLADHHANPHRRSARTARRNRRPAAAGSRSQDRRSGHAARRSATTSRANCAPAGTS